MENGPFIDDFPIKTSIYMAMLNNQRVSNMSNSSRKLGNTHEISPVISSYTVQFGESSMAKVL
jgi:hypothetical protein